MTRASAWSCPSIRTCWRKRTKARSSRASPGRRVCPTLPAGIESTSVNAEGEQLKLALLPIGNVVRGRRDRRHPESVAADVREMLDNLVGGRARDSVQKAIDDLLNSI